MFALPSLSRLSRHELPRHAVSQVQVGRARRAAPGLTAAPAAWASQRRHHRKSAAPHKTRPRTKTSLRLQRRGKSPPKSAKGETAAPASVSASGCNRWQGATWTNRARFFTSLPHWSQRILLVDSCNVMSSRVRRSWWNPTGKFDMGDFANQLARLARRNGCHVFAMVEGAARTLAPPDGLHVIRAQDIRRKNVGDDALVHHVEQALRRGIVEPHRLVLITADKGLMARMPCGVHKLSPHWLWMELARGGKGSGCGTASPMTTTIGAASLVGRDPVVVVAVAAAGETDAASWRRWLLDWSSYLRSMMRMPLWSSHGSDQEPEPERERERERGRRAQSPGQVSAKESS